MAYSCGESSTRTGFSFLQGTQPSCPCNASDTGPSSTGSSPQKGQASLNAPLQYQHGSVGFDSSFTASRASLETSSIITSSSEEDSCPSNASDTGPSEEDSSI